MERGIGALDDAGVKAQAAWREQCGRFAQIGQESLLQPGDLLAWDQDKRIAGSVQHLDGMREAETIGVQVGLAGGSMHPPAYEVMGQEQPVEFLSHQAWVLDLVAVGRSVADGSFAHRCRLRSPNVRDNTR